MNNSSFNTVMRACIECRYCQENSVYHDYRRIFQFGSGFICGYCGNSLGQDRICIPGDVAEFIVALLKEGYFCISGDISVHKDGSNSVLMINRIVSDRCPTRCRISWKRPGADEKPANLVGYVDYRRNMFHGTIPDKLHSSVKLIESAVLGVCSQLKLNSISWNDDNDCFTFSTVATILTKAGEWTLRSKLAVVVEIERLLAIKH